MKRTRFAWLPVRVYDSASRYLDGGYWTWLRKVVETEHLLYGWVAYTHDQPSRSPQSSTHGDGNG